MQRTTIMLPHDLKLQALRFSESKGISLGQPIRDCLRETIGQAEKEGSSQDCFFSDKAVYQGDSPADLSVDHDAYLYGNQHDIH